MVSLVSTLLACLGFTGALVQAALTTDEINAFLVAHNVVRARLSQTASNMVLLTWNAESAARAQTWGDSLAASSCSLSHGGTISNEGQNLYMSAASTLPANTVTANNSVFNWESEKTTYSYTLSAFSASTQAGHFTQEVWATTTQVGCAISTGTYSSYKCVVVTCNYYPAGNYIGQYPYTSGTPCSSCPTSYPACTTAYGQGLCYNGTAAATPTPSSTATPSASSSKAAAASPTGSASASPSSSPSKGVSPSATPPASAAASPSKAASSTLASPAASPSSNAAESAAASVSASPSFGAPPSESPSPSIVPRQRDSEESSESESGSQSLGAFASAPLLMMAWIPALFV